MKNNILIVGHSHVECLRKPAASLTKRGFNISILNVRRLQRSNPNEASALSLITHAAPEPQDAVCLCLLGNKHNLIGLLEHPQPFYIDDDAKGAKPVDYPDRWPIHYSLMRDSFRAYYKSVRPLAQKIYDQFSSAKRLMLNAPPPISDWEHIKVHPGGFADKIKLGPAPDELKIKLYQIQTSIVKEIADENNADFIDLSREVTTKDGFLQSGYFNTDPTHGNSAYGAVAINRILEKLGYIP